MQLYASIAIAFILVQAVSSSTGIHLSVDTASVVPLDKWLKQIDLRACLDSSPADLLFVVDGSKSVGSNNFHFLLKSALIDTISRFKIGADFTEVGALVFSDQVSQVIPIGRFDDKLQLLSEVSQLRYVDSFTSIEAAVEGTAAELQRRSNQLNRTHTAAAIADRKTVVVFFTDGWDTHGSSFYLRELIAHLHLEVSAVLTLGLENSNGQILQQLASDVSLVFNPTTFPEFQAALLNLLNPKCSDTCHKYEEQLRQAERGIEVTVSYINTVAENFMQLSRQRVSLLEYIRQVNASTQFANKDIKGTCTDTNGDLLETLVTMRQQYFNITNSTDLISTLLAASEADIVQISNELSKDVFNLTREVMIQKVTLQTMQQQEQQVRMYMERRLANKRAISKVNEETLLELEKRIQEEMQLELRYKKELDTAEDSTGEWKNTIEDMQEKNTILVEKLKTESTELTRLQILANNSGDAVFQKLEEEIKYCQSYVRNHETVLFAIRGGSGADFSLLFSRNANSFAKEAFVGLSQSQPIYKSQYLQYMHQLGFFKDAALQFFVGGNVVATLSMDTSRMELANIFSRFHVTSSFPYVASYINSVYRTSLSHFRLRHHEQFVLLFGDMAKFLKSDKCSDLEGVFVILGAAHRCFPRASRFPAIYMAASPYGGEMSIEVEELRLVTRQLPKPNQRLNSIIADEQFIDETLLFVRAGAGVLAPRLLSDYSTSASVLLEVEDITDLNRHYKSSLLNTIDINKFERIVIELYDSRRTVVAELTFKGPFGAVHQLHSQGSTHASWSWFKAQFLDDEQVRPFDFRLMKAARFEMYSGDELLSIGMNMAASCESRKYFMTIVDGQSQCECFRSVNKPAIFFTTGSRPVTCDSLQQAQSLRIVGRISTKLI